MKMRVLKKKRSGPSGQAQDVVNKIGQARNAAAAAKRTAHVQRPGREPAPMINAADYYKQNEVEPYIELYNGERFYIYRPHFDIDVIAHGLAKNCRYTGQCKRFFSVAEHSVLVAKLMEDLNLGDPFEGLMHDGTEAYLSDLAAPWKALLPDYKKLEAQIELPLRRHFGLPDTITAGCKRADWLALFIEANTLMATKAKDWIAPDGIKEQAAELCKDIARYPIQGWYDVVAQRLFEKAFAVYSTRPAVP